LRFGSGFVALALAIATPSFCQAQVTGLGSAANYAILVDNGTGNGTAGDTNAQEIQLHSHAMVNIPGSNGNVGLVNGAGIQLLGTSGSTPYASMTIGGTLYYDSTAWSPPASTNPIILSVNPGNTFTATGGQTGVAKSTSPPDALTAAWTAATNASTANASLASTPGVTTSSSSINGSSVAGTVAVVNLSSINTTTLTITGNGTGNQFFLINVSGSISLTNVVLAGGVTANQVLFNDTGNAGITLGAGTVYGTFLDTSTNSSNPGITVNGTTLNGELIVGGTDNTGGIQFSSSSSSTINMTPIMTEAVVATPELPTISMASVALLLVLGGAGFRRVRRTRAA